jgi:dCMP deaminase
MMTNVGSMKIAYGRPMLKDKHIKAYMEMCRVNAKLSECLRTDRHFGAILVDPINNVVIASGYNGYLRGGSKHCGGEGICVRQVMKIKSGEKFEIGCIHAEENVYINAGRQGVSTVGSILFVNAEPCNLCARRIIQSGTIGVFCQNTGYPVNGIETLRKNGIYVEVMD